MSIKCNLINIGEINRYIIFIFIGAIFYAGFSSIESGSIPFNEEVSEIYFHPIILNIIYSLGSSLAFILLIIYKIYNKKNNEGKLQKILYIKKHKIQINKKEKFFWILLVSIIEFTGNLISSIYWVGENSNLSTYTIDIIFLSLFSYLILKEKLYKHHYVSIISIMILGILLNIFNNKFTIENFKNNFLNIIFIFLSQIIFQLTYALYKYYVIKKYIISYEIMFYQGIIQLILFIIILIITTKIGKLDNFWDYYNNLDAKEIIIFIVLIIFVFIYDLSLFITIDKYSPFYIMLLDTLAELIFYFVDFDTDDPMISISSIIINILVFLMILIFVEIIELNFFDLSYMTQKNIKIRAQQDSALEGNDEDNETKINYQDYDVELNERKLTEMIQIDSKFSDNE